ncbi:unnamed protein product [Phytophthora fragariaefolia]|uniref:Unnamed protein product n=1 Tax=Phytophthora fragariaefolia TaxID=1490495 RepID=A0A9W6WKI9_9STRA|nr:unnamed protein product [Phytophthora fragariaefolia]
MTLRDLPMPFSPCEIETTGTERIVEAYPFTAGSNASERSRGLEAQSCHQVQHPHPYPSDSNELASKPCDKHERVSSERD